MPVFLSPSTVSTNPAQRNTNNDLPRFGRGSSSCAGSEKRTEAISATPTNLVPNHISVWRLVICVAQRRRCGGAKEGLPTFEGWRGKSSAWRNHLVPFQALRWQTWCVFKQGFMEKEKVREIGVQSNRKGGKLREVGDEGGFSVSRASLYTETRKPG